MLATADICSGPGLLTVDDALTVALAAVRRALGTETVQLRCSIGRVAACDVTASMPLPPFDRSAVDGYGIHRDDLAAMTTSGFRQVGTTFAGANHTVCPDPGEAVRLLTGAPIPLGVDAVVMEEKVRVVGAEVTFDRLAERGLNIRRRGEDVGAGSTIVETGSYRGRHHPVAALTMEKFAHRSGRLEFVPVRVAALDDRGVPLLQKLGRGGSARLLPLIVADGLASVRAEIGDLPPLAPIDYYPFATAFGL